jgi:hypothetical protein
MKTYLRSNLALLKEFFQIKGLRLYKCMIYSPMKTGVLKIIYSPNSEE